jgi:hypothetical protein
MKTGKRDTVLNFYGHIAVVGNNPENLETDTDFLMC